MRIRAYAKVNLGLEVLSRREDGYHEVRTILQTIDLHDSLDITPGDELELVSSEKSLAGPDNLVLEAARALGLAMGRRAGARIELVKRIPVGRGLGGGSADAAMTLVALNQLWQAGLSHLDLHELAREIGADVPFFLVGGTCLGIGRGDEVFPLARQADVPIVLITPDFAIPTASAYGNLILTKCKSGLTLQCFAFYGLSGAEILTLENHLESALGEHFPTIERYKQILLERGALQSFMSGSGSAVVGIFRKEEAARSTANWLVEKGVAAMATRTLTQSTYQERMVESQPRTGEP